MLTFYENRTAKRSEYYVEGKLIGIRTFHPNGKVEMEEGYKVGKLHGNSYRFDDPGVLLFSTQYVEGLEHGTGYQWARDGRIIGSYEMEYGSGFDLWFDESYDDLEDRSVILSEAREYVDGLLNGYEWWFSDGKIYIEQHYHKGELSGIERNWNDKGNLTRGCPRYWIEGLKVSRIQYLKALKTETHLPPFRIEDNQLERVFPPIVRDNLVKKTIAE